MTLALIGVWEQFWAALALIVVWGLLFAAAMPIRQAYLNGLIPSQQRATILSFDSMLSSSGGVVIQPVLGRSADVWGYPDLVRARRRHLGAGAAVRVSCRGGRRRPPTARSEQLHRSKRRTRSRSTVSHAWRPTPCAERRWSRPLTAYGRGPSRRRRCSRRGRGPCRGRPSRACSGRGRRSDRLCST